ncbi:MAG: CPBP family intramembrane metalloprotease [Bacteroidetes bacterium]|nr:CPBP family intramembrane metalloprotease [Bacteroidota bacterium]
MKTESRSNQSLLNNIKQALKINKLAKVTELITVFAAAFLFIKLFESKNPHDLIYNQAVIWFANIIMLSLVYLGLKLRGESLADFGFSFKKFNWKFGFKTFLQSLVVFILALSGFIIGSIIMANITGIPETSDMSNYDYLQDNLGMLILTLVGVYIVASIGEEVIYRAFLINRISELGLNSKKGTVIVVIISSIIFGFAHYSWGPMGIVQTGFMGLALGLSYLYLKKRIWVLIFAHAYMDTILMLQMYFN